MMKDFTCFAQSILQTGEGIFWSMDRSVVGEKACHWTTKLEDLGTCELENDGFVITDWKGERVVHYALNGLENLKTWKLEDQAVEAFWEDLPSVSLGIEGDLADYLVDEGETYQKKIRQIQEAQKRGEMWVMNLATQLEGKLKNLGTLKLENGEIIEREPFYLLLALKAYYRFLRSGRPHCGGVIWTPELKCVSFSPEVFLHQSQPQVIDTFPIKGTGTKAYLETSEKEISELLMVTDLLRNDLGMIADKVAVPNQRFLTDEGAFYHAQSHIQAHLLNSHLTLDQLKKLLPAGSMSGCPKSRVCRYIQQLESFDRRFYAGTFGIKSGDRMTLGLLIRTLFFGDTRWYYPVGAGITMESDPESEAQELLIKGQNLVDFFG